MIQLNSAPARKDLSDRECSKVIGGVLGSLVLMADANDVRNAIRWWAENDEAWKNLERAKSLGKMFGL